MTPARRAFALALLVLPAGGCATVLVGRAQSVTITSTPPGARATVLPDGVQVTTPADVELWRKRSHTVRCELPGYRPTNAYIDPLPGGAAYGNLVLGGIIGILVDLNTGAAFTLSPDPVEIVLEPEPIVDPSAGPAGGTP